MTWLRRTLQIVVFLFFAGYLLVLVGEIQIDDLMEHTRASPKRELVPHSPVKQSPLDRLRDAMKSDGR